MFIFIDNNDNQFCVKRLASVSVMSHRAVWSGFMSVGINPV